MKNRENKVQKNTRKYKKRKLGILFLISFILGFQAALTGYILSSFLKERIGGDSIAVFFLLGSLVSFYVLIKLHYLIKSYGKTRVFLMFLLFNVMTLAGMGFFWCHQVSVIFVVWSLISGTTIWACLDVVIENFSDDNVTGAIRGKQLTILNFGYLFTPVIAVAILNKFGFQWVFFSASFLTFVAVVIVLVAFRGINHNIREAPTVKSVVAKMIKRKNIARIYYVAFLLNLFYAITTVYVPLHLLSLGITWSQIGLIFFLMLIPFVFLQYPLGIFADKKAGEKEMLMVAIIILGIFTVAIGLMNSAWVLGWILVLFCTRIGAAAIEVLRDSYFYKQIGPEDVDLIDFFRTTGSASYIIGMAISGVTLLFFSINSIFFILAVIIFSGLIPLWKLKDTK